MKNYFLVFPTYCYLKPNGDSLIQSFGVILYPYGRRRQKQPRQKNNDKSFFSSGNKQWYHFKEWLIMVKYCLFFNCHLGYSFNFTVVYLCHVMGGIPPPSGRDGGNDFFVPQFLDSSVTFPGTRKRNKYTKSELPWYLCYQF